MENKKAVLRDFEKALENLKKQRNSYDSLSHNLEERFLKTGDVIESFMTNNASLAEHSDRLYKLSIGDEEGSVIEKTMTFVISLLDYIVRYIGETREVMVGMSGCHKLFEPLLSYEDRLLRAYKPLRFTQTLFLIQSSNLEEGHGEIFTVLAGEVSEMFREVTSLSANEFGKFKDVNTSMDKTFKKLNEETQEQEKTVASQRDNVENYFSELERSINLNRSTNIGLNKVTQGISYDIQAIMTVLQNEDIAGQKLQHVIETIDDLSEKMDAWMKSGKDLSDKETLASFAYISKVQIAQLRSIIADFKQTKDVVNQKSSEMGIKVDELGSECIAFREFKVLATSAGGMVESLLKMMQEAMDMITVEIGLAEEVYNILKPFSSISSGITTKLKKLSGDLRLVAINAQLKASNVGKGTGLETLASTVCNISDESDIITNHVDKQFHEITAMIADLIESFRNLYERGLSEKEESLKGIEAVNQELHGYRNSALDTMLELGSCADTIMCESEKLNQNFDDNFNISQYFEDLIVCFEMFVKVGEAACDGDIQQYCKDDDSSKPQYTMQEEWDIHKKVMAGESVTDESLSKDNPADVDLFDDFSSGLEESSPATEVALAEVNSSSSDSSFQNKKEVKPEAFGGNVDLF